MRDALLLAGAALVALSVPLAVVVGIWCVLRGLWWLLQGVI